MQILVHWRQTLNCVPSGDTTSSHLKAALVCVCERRKASTRRARSLAFQPRLLPSCSIVQKDFWVVCRVFFPSFFPFFNNSLKLLLHLHLVICQMVSGTPNCAKCRRQIIKSLENLSFYKGLHNLITIKYLFFFFFFGPYCLPIYYFIHIWLIQCAKSFVLDVSWCFWVL